jgi:hypothetical protein
VSSERIFLVGFALLLMFALPLPSWSEPLQGRHPPASAQPTNRQPTVGSLQAGQPPAPEDEARAKLERDMAKKANQERQADLKRDTDKLLQLATELKQYVDKTNENVLSLEVLKKAEQIEKLAHSVKEKMKAN